MTPENAQKAIDNLKNVYALKEKQLKLFKQLEIGLKGTLLGIDVTKRKMTQIPDHDKNFHYVNDDVVVGLKDTETNEVFYFDEPVFNVKNISVSNPTPKLNPRRNYYSSSSQTIAEKYLLNKFKEERQKEKEENG